MNRRDLFKSLFVAAPAVAIAEKAPRVRNGDDVTDFGQWKIQWTGWKKLPNIYSECGQWIAVPSGFEMPSIYRWSNSVPVRPHGAYSSIPGYVGWFLMGECFDISLQEGQVFVNPQISEDERLEHKYLALDRLIDFLRTSKVGC